jgi:hypothetical protein
MILPPDCCHLRHQLLVAGLEHDGNVVSGKKTPHTQFGMPRPDNAVTQVQKRPCQVQQNLSQNDQDLTSVSTALDNASKQVRNVRVRRSDV